MTITDFGLGDVVPCVGRTGKNYVIREYVIVKAIGNKYLTAISRDTNREYKFIGTDCDCKYLTMVKPKTGFLLLRNVGAFYDLKMHADLSAWFLQNINRDTLKSRFTTDQLYRAKKILCGCKNIESLNKG